MHLLGHEVRERITFAPASGRMGITLSLLTYGGRLQLGVASDEHVMPDPQTFIAAIEDELTAPVARDHGMRMTRTR